MTRFISFLLLAFLNSSRAPAQAIPHTLSLISLDCQQGQHKHLREKHCILWNQKREPLHRKLTPQRLVSVTHLHLPRLSVYEEEDDVLGDNLYMWFVITLDGVTRSHITKIYKGLRSGDIVVFDEVDRVINQSLYKNSLIVDFGLVENDGDDITMLREITAIGIRLFQGSISDEDRRQLHELTSEFYRVLSTLPNDDRLITGSYHITTNDIVATYQSGGVYEVLQKFNGRNYWSDWSYGIVWRHLLIDISRSAL